MKLDRTLVLAMGLAAAGLVTLGLTLGTERWKTSRPPMPAPSTAVRACVAAVVEHSACALPPRHVPEQDAPPLRSSPLR